MMQVSLKEARDRRKWTQQDLADRSGVDISTISRIESGATTNPSNATAAAIELALGLKRGTLVFGDQAVTERAS